jgi:hypothetical protein
MCIEIPLFSFEVPHPATTDNAAGAEYVRRWMELNFPNRAELFRGSRVNINVCECGVRLGTGGKRGRNRHFPKVMGQRRKARNMPAAGSFHSWFLDKACTARDCHRR